MWKWYNLLLNLIEGGCRSVFSFSLAISNNELAINKVLHPESWTNHHFVLRNRNHKKMNVYGLKVQHRTCNFFMQAILIPILLFYLAWILLWACTENSKCQHWTILLFLTKSYDNMTLEFCQPHLLTLC